MAVIQGGSSGNLAEVDAANQQLVRPSNTPANTGTVRCASEVDAGTVTGSPLLLSAEADGDYRLRVSHENLLDAEVFNYTAQNTGKHRYDTTTLTMAWSAGQLTTNSGSTTTASSGAGLSTWAEFPLLGASAVYVEMVAGFSAQPISNTVIDFGLFRRNTGGPPFAPTDGAYFRLTSAGLQGVVNYAGTETTTSVFAFTYVNSQRYQFILAVTDNTVQFWIDGVLYGSLPRQAANGGPFAAASQPLSVRHAIVGGTAGGVIQFLLGDYAVSAGGVHAPDSLGVVGNRVYGSYQGLSGGTMGSLANFANNANPTAAVPTNTTAALGTGLGGQFWETDTLAVTTDGIICSYQVPAGGTGTSTQGRRLRLAGVKIESYVQTALTGGGYNAVWSLAFGHTAVSLATAEAATAKAARRIPLGNQSVAAGAAALTELRTVQATFANPVYVNPGEFVAVVKKKVGTAPSAGVIAHTITLDYGWE
jgi:hypothetical protein